MAEPLGRLANQLDAFANTLSERERLVLHRLIWEHLHPVDRARFSVAAPEFTAEEEALMANLERGTRCVR